MKIEPMFRPVLLLRMVLLFRLHGLSAGRIVFLKGLFRHVFRILPHTIDPPQKVLIFVAHLVHLLARFPVAALEQLPALPMVHANPGRSNLRIQCLCFPEPYGKSVFQLILHLEHVDSIHAGKQIGNSPTVFFQFGGSLQHSYWECAGGRSPSLLCRAPYQRIPSP